jgi:hypothetical protein
MLLPLRADAQWWSRAPADFEECADAAEKAPSKEQKTAALGECNARFAGRRKPGGGYTYYDFMQDRTFDIAGPNPTSEEQRYIDQQYTLYLENQRRDGVTTALAARQPQQVQQASLKTDAEKPPVPPMPQERPAKQPQAAAPVDARARQKPPTDCAKHEFACNWPKLSESLNDLKRLFAPAPPNKEKRS